MKILITGANGFIGQRIIKRFQDSPIEVIGSGRRPPKSNSIAYAFRTGDISLPEHCDALLDGVDSVIHCAGKAGTWGPRSDYFKANVIGTENLLQSCRRKNIKRFINISSPSIYFDYKDQLNLKENQIPTRFSNAYAETKYLAEKKVQEAHSEKLHTVSLRPRGVIGAGDQNWLPRIIEMKKENKLIQPGNGQNQVDFTSVENLIDAIDICLKTPKENLGRTFNITNGKPEKLWDVIEFVLKNIHLDTQRRRVPTPLALAIARISESYHSLRNTLEEPKLLPVKVGVAAYSMTLNIDDAKNILGYRPRVTTADALKEFLFWWKDLLEKS